MPHESTNRALLRCRGFFIALACIFLSCCVAEFAQAGPSRKQRRILYNLDGDSCMTLKAGRVGPGPIALPDLTNLVTELTHPGSQVDTLLVCANAQVMYYPSSAGTLRGTLSTVTEKASWTPHERQRLANMAAFFDRGIDPYAVIINEAKRRGLEVLLTFRMNDDHGNDFLRTAFWRDHPECRLGRGALDFGQSATREYVLRLVEEAIRRYAVDGIELDFQRFPTFFADSESSSLDARLSLMTDLVGRVRKLLDTEGSRRGTRLILAVRAPTDTGRGTPLPAQSRSARRACDIAAWARNGWIDFLTVSEFLFTADTLGLSGWREAVPGVPLYAAIQPESAPSANDRRPEHALGPAGYRRLAAERWADGADGIYLFNFFTTREWPEPFEPPWEVLSAIGDPKTIQPKP